MSATTEQSNEHSSSRTGRIVVRPCYRLHPSTYIVLLLTAVAIFLLNVPGQFVPHIHFGGLEQHRIEFPLWEHLEHGWPWTYLEQNAYSGLLGSDGQVDLDGQLSLEPLSAWSFGQHVTSFRPLALCLDLAFNLVSLAVCAAAFECWRRQRNHLLQFRLSDALLGVAILAFALGYAAHIAREHRQERAVLMQLGPPKGIGEPTAQQHSGETRCTFYHGLSWVRGSDSDFSIPWFDRVVGIDLYDVAECQQAALLSHLKVVNLHLWTPPASYPGDVLLPLASLKNLEALRLIGYCPFELEDRRANYTYEASDAEIAAVLHEMRSLPKLIALDLNGSDIGDRSAAELGQFPRLQKIDVRNTILSDEGLRHIGSLQTLDELRLGGSRLTAGITGSGLRHLIGQSLQQLQIDDMGIADDGLAHVAKLAKLRELDLSYSSVRGPGLVHLQELAGLRHLWLPSDIDRKAARRLQEQLPQVKIEFGRPGQYLILGRH